MKWKRIVGILLVLLICYGFRVHAVNTSEIVEYAQPTTLEYPSNETVELAPGYYNIGYVDLSGYYIVVTGAHIVRTEDFLLANGYDNSFYDTAEVSRKYQYIYIVDAVFYFDGDNDPLENAIDLTSFKLVGDDYYCNFSYELNALDSMNPILGGNNMFSIGSGNKIELQLPFLIDTESVWGVSLEYLFSHVPQLMVSQYPYEVYISLPSMEV